MTALHSEYDTSIKLYRLIADAWEGGVARWCELGGEFLQEGVESWVVVSHLSVARWMRQKFLYSEKALLGLNFLTPEMLRQKCAHMFSLPLLDVDGVSRELIYRVLSWEEGQEMPNGAKLRRELERWEESEILGLDVTEQARSEALCALRQWLQDRKAWNPSLQKEISQRASQGGRLGRVRALFFNPHLAQSLASFGLWQALFPHFSSVDAYFSMPREESEKIDQEWIDLWTESLGCEPEISPDSGFVSANATLCEYLEGFADSQKRETEAPLFFSCLQAADQGEIAMDRCLQWMERREAGDRLAVVVPSRNASYHALVRSLEQEQIPFWDGLHRREDRGVEVLQEEALLQFLLGGRDIEDLLECLSHFTQWIGFDFAEIRTALKKSFSLTQSRDSLILVDAVAPVALRERLQEWLFLFEGWDETQTFAVHWSRWRNMLESLSIAPSQYVSSQATVESLLEEKIFLARFFFEYRQKVLQTFAVSPRENFVTAPLALVRWDQVVDQVWSKVMFLDCEEGVWPEKKLSGREYSLEGVESGGFSLVSCLNSLDMWRMKWSEFLHILENSQMKVEFLGLAQVGERGQVSVRWNDFVQRCAKYRPLRTSSMWRGSRSSRKKSLDSHWKEVHRRRREGSIPFDEYLGRYDSLLKKAETWSVTSLDELQNFPSTFQMEQLFGARPWEGRDFERSHRLVVGIATHQWLADIFGSGKALQELLSMSQLEEKLCKVRAKWQGQLAAIFNPIPAWWVGIGEQVAWSVRQCLQRVNSLGAYPLYYWSEKSVEMVYPTNRGDLHLRGRMDLVLLDAPDHRQARGWIVDFKTGAWKKPSVARMQSGAANQFPGYALLAEHIGVARFSAVVITPEEVVELGLSRDQGDQFADLWEYWAQRQNQHLYGWSARASEYGREEIFPMATVPLELGILEEKWKLENLS